MQDESLSDLHDVISYIETVEVNGWSIRLEMKQDQKDQNFKSYYIRNNDKIVKIIWIVMADVP